MTRTGTSIIGITPADAARGTRWIEAQGLTTAEAVEQYMHEPEYWQRRFAATGYIEDAMLLLDTTDKIEREAREALRVAWDALMLKNR